MRREYHGHRAPGIDEGQCGAGKQDQSHFSIDGEGTGTRTEGILRDSHESHRQLYAFERSPIRFKTLEKMIARASCSNVNLQRADFLDADPSSTRYARVTRMYVQSTTKAILLTDATACWTRAALALGSLIDWTIF